MITFKKETNKYKLDVKLASSLNNLIIPLSQKKTIRKIKKTRKNLVLYINGWEDGI